jgi:hypothetical protein
MGRGSGSDGRKPSLWLLAALIAFAVGVYVMTIVFYAKSPAGG